MTSYASPPILYINVNPDRSGQSKYPEKLIAPMARTMIMAGVALLSYPKTRIKAGTSNNMADKP